MKLKLVLLVIAAFIIFSLATPSGSNDPKPPVDQKQVCYSLHPQTPVALWYKRGEPKNLLQFNNPCYQMWVDQLR